MPTASAPSQQPPATFSYWEAKKLGNRLDRMMRRKGSAWPGVFIQPSDQPGEKRSWDDVDIDHERLELTFEATTTFQALARQIAMVSPLITEEWWAEIKDRATWWEFMYLTTCATYALETWKHGHGTPDDD